MTHPCPERGIALVVANPQALQHGSTPRHRFNLSGGTIGSQNASWTLVDKAGRVRTLHCEIRHSDDAFCVIDRSGRTRVNDAGEPLGAMVGARLSDGDLLHIGPYLITVHLEDARHAMPDASRHLAQYDVSEILNEHRDGLDGLPAGRYAFDRAGGTPAGEEVFQALAAPRDAHADQDPLRALDEAERSAHLAPTQPDLASTPRAALNGAPKIVSGDRRMSQSCEPTLSDGAWTRTAHEAAVAMTRSILIGLAACLLAGCSTVGNVLTKTGQILMDPSIPVGAPDDQPSQIGLSLYAAGDVNPNPASAPAPQPTEAREAAGTAGGGDGAFEVSFRSDSRRELIAELHSLLNALEDTAPSAQPLRRADRGSSRVSQARAEPDRASLPAVIAVSPHYLPHRGFGAAPALASQQVTRAPLPLALEDGADPGADGTERGLGQYSRGTGLAFPPPDAPARNIATPIAFKVLQLKDDSLLLNADALLLAKDLGKALGNTLVTQDDYVLQPGQFKYIDFARIREDTRYIAIVADFHAQNGAVWKQAFRLEPKGRRYALLLTLTGTRVAITDESHRPLPSSSQP